MTDKELGTITEALKQIQINHKEWAKDYIYNIHNNEFRHKDEPEDKMGVVVPWFELEIQSS